MPTGSVLFLIRVAAVRGRINASINQSLDQSYSLRALSGYGRLRARCERRSFTPASTLGLLRRPAAAFRMLAQISTAKQAGTTIAAKRGTPSAIRSAPQAQQRAARGSQHGPNSWRQLGYEDAAARCKTFEVQSEADRIELVLW
jgi:hypothetical protein